MSESSLHRLRDSATGPRVAVVAAYVVLGAALVWSRLFQLGHSFWTDEILMVDGFVRAGPREILTGSGLNHQLMALLSWATTSVVGESEIALRLLSAVPFIAGVVLVTVWLHMRLGPLSGVLFLFLATVSPMLLDITRQARGYGIAFLAMSVLVVAALEATRTGRLGGSSRCASPGSRGRGHCLSSGSPSWRRPWSSPSTGAFASPTAIGLVVSIAADRRLVRTPLRRREWCTADRRRRPDRASRGS